VHYHGYRKSVQTAVLSLLETQLHPVEISRYGRCHVSAAAALKFIVTSAMCLLCPSIPDSGWMNQYGNSILVDINWSHLQIPDISHEVCTVPLTAFF
jgi:hypothetical protein